MSSLARTATILLIIGALNWGLVGFFNYDLVASIFGGQTSALSRIIYSLVGLAGLYQIFNFPTRYKRDKTVEVEVRSTTDRIDRAA